MSGLLYKVRDLGKLVQTPGGGLAILEGVNLDIDAGESLAIIGASGSGKSTLLHLLGALDKPTHGFVQYAGADMAAMSATERAAFRNKELGFVFQFHHLLPEFSTLENVAMQALLGGMGKASALKLAGEALERVGLADRLEHSVSTLSGGERQRAAIARATLLRPKVLLADEPTGNLDEKSGELVIDLMLELNMLLGMTLVVVTHNRELALRLGRCVELRSGKIFA